jgi:hypothetical protein
MKKLISKNNLFEIQKSAIAIKKYDGAKNSYLSSKVLYFNCKKKNSPSYSFKLKPIIHCSLHAFYSYVTHCENILNILHFLLNL